MNDKKTRSGRVPKRRAAPGAMGMAVMGAAMAAAMAPIAAHEISLEPRRGREPRFKPLDPKNLPDRMSGDPDSPYYHPECTQIIVFFNAVRRPNDVNEYCVSEGWITTISRDRRGNLVRHNGKNGKPIVSRPKQGSVIVAHKSQENKDA